MVISCTVVQPVGMVISSRSCICHTPFSSIITLSGWYSALSSVSFSMLNSSRLSMYSVNMFFLRNFSSSYSSSPSSQTKSSILSPFINSGSSKVTFMKLVLPDSRNPFIRYTGVSIFFSNVHESCEQSLDLLLVNLTADNTDLSDNVSAAASDLILLGYMVKVDPLTLCSCYDTLSSEYGTKLL